jgi:hypothetical protein
MKTKNAAIFLAVASAIWILTDIYWTINRFTGSGWRYYRQNPLDLILSTIAIVIPIALLLFALSFINNKQEPVHTTHDSSSLLSEPEIQIPTVGDWIINYLITSIPLVGLIFLIIWANDDKNIIRKNWAIAALIWSLIISFVFILIYTSMANSRRRGFYD